MSDKHHQIIYLSGKDVAAAGVDMPVAIGVVEKVLARFLQFVFATLFRDVSYAQGHCSWHYRHTFQILPNQHSIARLAGGSPVPGPRRQLGWLFRRHRRYRYESQRPCQLSAR